MKGFSLTILLVILVSFTTKCSLFESSNVTILSAADFPEPMIKLDNSIYVLDTTAWGINLRMKAVITNYTNQQLYFENHSNAPLRVLEKQIDGSWQVVHESWSTRRVVEPIVLGPGETMEDDIVLSESNVFNAFPDFTMQKDDVAGDYQLRYVIYQRWDKAENGNVLLPLEGRVSSQFRME